MAVMALFPQAVMSKLRLGIHTDLPWVTTKGLNNETATTFQKPESYDQVRYPASGARDSRHPPRKGGLHRGIRGNEGEALARGQAIISDWHLKCHAHISKDRSSVHLLARYQGDIVNEPPEPLRIGGF
jgi:hypothetical protein